MGDDYEDFISDSVIPLIEKKLKLYDLISPKFYIDVTDYQVGNVDYYGWAGQEYGQRAMEHAYEAPWKSGVITINIVDDDENIKLKDIEVIWSGGEDNTRIRMNKTDLKKIIKLLKGGKK